MTQFRELKKGDKFVTTLGNRYMRMQGYLSVALSGNNIGGMIPFPFSQTVDKINEPPAMHQLLDDMCERIAANAHKGDTWANESVGGLLRRVQEEMGELVQAVCEGHSVSDVRQEAADVANFLWMLVEVYEAKLKCHNTVK